MVYFCLHLDNLQIFLLSAAVPYRKVVKTALYDMVILFFIRTLL